MKIQIVVILFLSLVNTYAQGISIGASADIPINLVDGNQFPFEQIIEFNLGEVKGEFSITIEGSFNDSEDVPYISRFQGLINLYQSSSPTPNDYRHINDNEVLSVKLSNILITEGYDIYIEGLNGKMLNDDIILFENSSGRTDTIVGISDDPYYALFSEMIPVSENDTINIITLEGAWRLDYLRLVFIKSHQQSDYLKFLGTNEYSESRFKALDFGRYYLNGHNSLEQHPRGVSALVIDNKKDTFRIAGRYAFESDDFMIDMGILRPGDEVLTLLGQSEQSDPSQWNIELVKKPQYNTSHYPDPEELPLSKTSTLDQLDIFHGGHPRVFSFRNDYLAHQGYDVFYSTIIQTQGAAPKCLAEERVPSNENLPMMQLLAESHPEKIILNHFSFDGMMVNHIPESYNFFSKEHWCYYPGTYLTKSLSKDDSIVNVRTSGRFKAPNKDGTAFRNDVVIIIPIDSLGKKIWNLAEFAAIKKIDYDSLTLLRGLFKTTAANYEEGSYIAPVFSHSGWNLGHDLQGYRGDLTYFFYNWAADCPLDSLGRNCIDAFVEFYESFLKPGGKFERFHGVMADVWRGNNDSRPLYQSEIYSRLIDYNVDGYADNGFDNRGYSMLAFGEHDFARKFRKMLGPNRIWTADGNGSNWPRVVPYLSGIESEGFDYHHDAFLKGWSGAINRFTYYQNNLIQTHQFNVAVPKILDYQEDYPDDVKKHHLLRQLTRAATTILELNNCANGVKTGGLAPNFWLADDYVKGVEDSTQWLGETIGEIIRPAKDSADLLNGSGQNLTSTFLNNWSSSDANIFMEDEAMCIQGKNDGLGVTQEKMHILYPMNIPEGDLFIRFMIKADSLRAFSADFPRYFFVTLNGIQSTEWTWETLEGMAGSHGYEEMTFYYRHAGPANVNIEIKFEGYEKVWIKDITIHNAQDVMAREYENGIVLVNPSADYFLFDLEKLFPGNSFRFIEGHEYEDFIGINYGNKVQGPILLNRHRGAFLIKEPITLSHEQQINSEWKCETFPVPTKNVLNILIDSPENREATFTLISMEGKHISTLNKQVYRGQNTFNIQTDQLNGLFVLKIKSNSIIENKIVIINN